MDKQTELNKLLLRIEELKPLVSKGFLTDTKLEQYKKKNQKIFDEYYDIFEKAEKLKWELMSPEQRAEEEELVKLMKLKRDGKL